MVAQIIQTNPTPFQKIAIDPITLDIIENALRNARAEMDATLFRTAMSPGIREQGDAFPLIANHEGKMVVGQFGSFLGGFLKNYKNTIEEGDVIWLSDPYSVEGAISHLNDWLIILPVFHDGRLVAWTCHFGHQTDVGGKVPGSLPTDATSIFQEGIRIPPIKLYRKGVLNEDVLELVLNNTRTRDWCRSDLNAIIASCRIAGRRIVEMCKRFQTDVYISAVDELLERNKRAMAKLIETSISTEKVSFEDYICDDGRGFGPFKLKATMWREGEKVILDWEGTSPQSESSINFYLNENMLKMFFGIYMIMVFDPQILFNDGFYDLVETRIPEGSLLKPKYPAALSCRTHGIGRVFDVLGALLGQRTPEFLNAAGFSSSPHLMLSGTYRGSGKYYQLFQIGFGGIPGRPFGDGPDGHSLWPNFTNVPNEFLEAYFPLRIERYETIPDSGGPGLHRGGNGVRISYRFLEPGAIAIHDDRWFTYPWGVNGGEPGWRSRRVLIRANGVEEVLAAKIDDIQVRPGDLLIFDTWGGGGWGDPLARDPALVATDVKRGLVTRDGAKRYGVVIAADGSVDAAATAALRDELATKRGEIGLFNFGGTIEELRERCLTETGLPAPKDPSQQNSVQLETTAA
ncbi:MULTISPECIES: hydantoinase B/oxoprolinase family protein [unclassified Azospirillum]|uniref:hydantoinase B/oxoprolinase family protein n=1 Tax=unclassified Azospirillum TaxID=2630922 RepID=UPI000B75F749|nr:MULTISPECIES: hydantoinase B/oxoprolinase family protein [unclassified Azospirillum]SNS14678.1 N-methylhydantoinase B [Azospirillum sp. RU38E]SNS31874.1 N-methylhydantoinase B [Azospirillum sp. RU37A]